MYVYEHIRFIERGIMCKEISPLNPFPKSPCESIVMSTTTTQNRPAPLDSLLVSPDLLQIL